MFSGYPPPSPPTRSAPSPPARSATSSPSSRRSFSLEPSTSPVPPSSRAQADNVDSEAPASTRRRPSLPGFLRSAASHEVPITRVQSPQTGRTKTMLRKHRAREQEELLRQQRLASQISQQPPQLPSPSLMPTIDGFGGDGRPDSVAMFSGKMSHYEHHPQQQQKQPQEQYRKPAVNNFSRPGYIAQTPSMNSLNSNTHRLESSSSLQSTGGTGNNYDLDSRTESMANRGRQSYASQAMRAAGTINSPRRTRRKKDPTPFNVLVIGAKKSGKTSFIQFLKTSLTLSNEKRSKSYSPLPETVSDAAFSKSYLETDLDGERIGMTIWDSKGLEKNIADLQLREMVSFIEAKFEDTFAEEQKVVRSPGVKDTHIHCVLLLLDPVRLDAEAAAASYQRGKSATPLDEGLDLQVLRALSGKTTVIPIVSKADTLTSAHMTSLKRNVWNSIQTAKLDPLEALGIEEDSEEEEPSSDDTTSSEATSSADIELPIHSLPTSHVPGVFDKVTEHTVRDYDEDDSSLIDTLVNRDSSSPPRTTPGSTPSPVTNLKASNKSNNNAKRTFSPTMATFAENSSTDDVYIPFSILSPDPYTMPHTLTRIFPWGEADPHNPAHCDFQRLRETVFGEWRSELRLVSREKWYEGWRTSRLKRIPAGTSTGRTSTGRVRPAGGASQAPREGRKDSSGSTGMDHVGDQKNIGSSSSKAEKAIGRSMGVAL